MSVLYRNISYNLLGRTSALLLALAGVRLFFRFFGSDALGVFYFAMALSATLRGALEMGVSSTTVREIAKHFHDEPRYVERLVRTAAALYWSVFLLLALLVWRVAPWLALRWLHLESIDVASATLLLRILAVAALLALPRGLYDSVCRGLERMELNNRIDVAMALLQQAVAILMMLLGAGLLPVVGWIAAAQVIWLATYLVVCGRVLSPRALLPSFFGDVIKRNRVFGSRMFLVSSLSMVQVQIDKLLVSKLLPVRVLGYYATLDACALRLGLVSDAVAQAAFPRLTGLIRRGGHEAAYGQYRLLARALCLGAVPLYCALVFAEPALFTALFNAEVARALLVPAIFLCLGYYMNATVNILYVYSLAAGQPRFAVRFLIYEFVVCVPSTIWLVRDYGLAGAAFSWVLAHLVGYVYFVPAVSSQCLRRPAGEWFRPMGLVALLTALTYAAALEAIFLTGRRDIQALLLAYGGATLAYGAGAYVLAGLELRDLLRAAAGGWLRRGAAARPVPSDLEARS